MDLRGAPRVPAAEDRRLVRVARSRGYRHHYGRNSDRAARRQEALERSSHTPSPERITSTKSCLVLSGQLPKL